MPKVGDWFLFFFFYIKLFCFALLCERSIIGTFLLGLKIFFFFLMLPPSNLVCRKIKKKEGFSWRSCLTHCCLSRFSFCSWLSPSKLYHDPILIWTHLILNSPVCHPIFGLGFVSCIMLLVGNVQTLLETFSFPCCKCVCTDTGYLLSTTLVCTANFRDCWAHTTCFSPTNCENVLQLVISSSFHMYQL